MMRCDSSDPRRGSAVAFANMSFGMEEQKPEEERLPLPSRWMRMTGMMRAIIVF